jgi:hypothetical protein
VEAPSEGLNIAAGLPAVLSAEARSAKVEAPSEGLKYCGGLARRSADRSEARRRE